MSLNSFTWNIYKQSEQGQKAINIFSDTAPAPIISTYAQKLPYSEEEVILLIDKLFFLTTHPKLPEEIDFEQAKELLIGIISNGVTLTYDDGETELIGPPKYDFLWEIPVLSSWLYFCYPDIFKPYFFQNNFDRLLKIADTFGIALPTVPLKRYKQERLLYYIDLCKAFSDFELANNLTPEEFCAFLYDFAPAYLKQTETVKEILPEPTQVWCVGGNSGDFAFLDDASAEDTHFWQGNEDTRKGDILVMYCLSPRSYIHSIWRAIRDGIADPFFHYYSNIYIGYGQKVLPITIHELKVDKHFSKHPLVRKNLQGIGGYPLSSEDYLRLQSLLTAKGFDTRHLPQLYSYIDKQNKELKNERAVEIYLIEPLLYKIGYQEIDWVRQFPIRMGRGERNFPDYVFLRDKTVGFENADMLIESKFWIKNNRELEDTFRQVWSYGQRLGANTLVIADKDALWIYEKTQAAFDRSNYTKLFWKQLENSDSFAQLKKKIGKR